jgi:hypothetical protein
MDNTEIARVREGQVVVVPTSPMTPGYSANARTQASMHAPQPVPTTAPTTASVGDHTEQLNQMSLGRARQGMDAPVTAGMATGAGTPDHGSGSSGSSMPGSIKP